MDAVYKSSPAAAFAAAFPRVLDARGTSSLATGFDGVDGTTLPGWLLRFSCSVSCIRCVSRTGQVSGRYQARIMYRAGIRQVSHMTQVSGQYQASIRQVSRIRQVSLRYQVSGQYNAPWSASAWPPPPAISGRYQARIMYRAGIRQVSHMTQVSGQYQASITYQAGIKSQVSITHLGLLLLGLRLLRYQVGIRHVSCIGQVSVKYHI
jgi:hypothetical protein